MVDVLRHLPYLKYVVFSNASKHPVLTRVPGEVGDFACMASMNEQELRRAILCIFWCLLLINSVNRKAIYQYSHQEESRKQEKKIPKDFEAVMLFTCLDPKPSAFCPDNKMQV
jgi:hypothetical protein